VITFCEECGGRIDVSQEEVDRSPGYILCRECGEVVKVASPRRLTMDLEISLGDRLVKMDPARPILTMGRKRHNDLVIRSSKVSRTHAAIVFLEDHYTLFDLSLNGTFVSFDKGQEILLRKNKVGLHGAGVIGLGRSLPSDPDQVIRFQLIGETGGTEPDGSRQRSA